MPKTTPKLNHVILILDRSGSMASIQASLNEKLITWAKEQRNIAPAGTLFTAVTFDDKYDVVYDRIDIQNIRSKSLQIDARGGTALNDAIMKATSNIANEDALIMIVTDGQENASKEVTYDQVVARLAELEKQGCSVVYMSSSVTAQKDAKVYNTTSVYTTNHTNAGTMVMDSALRSNSFSYYARGNMTAAQASIQIKQEEDSKATPTVKDSTDFNRQIQNAIKSGH